MSVLNLHLTLECLKDPSVELREKAVDVTIEAEAAAKKEIFGACLLFLVSVGVEFALEFQRLKDPSVELQGKEADAIKQAAANQSIFLQMCFLPLNVSVEFASDF